MNARTRIAALCLVAFALGAVAAAQQGVTFVLRSGERVNADLIDMGADFTASVNGQERRLPIGEVAIIDFVGGGQGLPATELSKIPASGHLTILRGGESFIGRLVDITGRPMQLVFSTEQGERRVDAGAIGRVYLARPDNLPAATAAGESAPEATPAGGVRVEVPGNVQWFDTGITVQRGARVSFDASGEIRLSSGSDDVAGPDGSRQQRYPRLAAPMPRVLAGALIGRIGSSQPFGIGGQSPVLSMPATGLLFLGVNDDDVRDNSGHFTVTIRR